MTPILDQVTSPSTTVAVSCHLLWRRTYQNNGALHDEREATAEVPERLREELPASRLAIGKGR